MSKILIQNPKTHFIQIAKDIAFQCQKILKKQKGMNAEHRNNMRRNLNMKKISGLSNSKVSSKIL